MKTASVISNHNEQNKTVCKDNLLCDQWSEQRLCFNHYNINNPSIEIFTNKLNDNSLYYSSCDGNCTFINCDVNRSVDCQCDVCPTCQYSSDYSPSTNGSSYNKSNCDSPSDIIILEGIKNDNQYQPHEISYNENLNLEETLKKLWSSNNNGFDDINCSENNESEVIHCRKCSEIESNKVSSTFPNLNTTISLPILNEEINSNYNFYKIPSMHNNHGQQEVSNIIPSAQYTTDHDTYQLNTAVTMHNPQMNLHSDLPPHLYSNQAVMHDHIYVTHSDSWPIQPNEQKSFRPQYQIFSSNTHQSPYIDADYRSNRSMTFKNSNYCHKGDEKFKEFETITNNIYQLIRLYGGKILMSQIYRCYEEAFKTPLKLDKNPKFFVKMQKLLLLNCDKTRSDVMMFYTTEPAYKLIISILRQNADADSAANSKEEDNHDKSETGNIISDTDRINNYMRNHGMLLSIFRIELEQRLGTTLDGCDLEDFLMRWRFLSIRKNNNSDQIIVFSPHQNGSTVFFGNLNVKCTENDIYQDLEEADSSWKQAAVRLKMGKGFAYAFVDFPTHEDALRAVQCFEGRAVFKSKYVSADIESIEQKKSRLNNNDIINNKYQGRNLNLTNINMNYHIQREMSPNIMPYNSLIDTNCNLNNGDNNNTLMNFHISTLSLMNKTTIYLGNLKDNVTKRQIQHELSKVNISWNALPVRLNLRNSWSHAFIDFEHHMDFKKLIDLWHNKKNSLLSDTRLRCEISKKQMI